jgi:quinol monooxygenase YgiN
MTPTGSSSTSSTADEAAFQAHCAAPHFRENVERGVVPLLADRKSQRYRLLADATAPGS